MNFSRKHLRLAAGLLGALFVGGVLAGCGNEAKSDEIKIGANFEMTGNVANYGAATLDGLKLAIKEVFVPEYRSHNSVFSSFDAPSDKA